MTNKPKKHKWITEAINSGDKILSVWPSKDDLSSAEKTEKFFETIQKIGDDPRVVDVRRIDHHEYKTVFLFEINKDNETATD